VSGGLLDFYPDRPIYPVAIKPPSGIRRWQDWPDDVRPVLERWNRQKGGLSFGNDRVFKCADCERFCRERFGCVFARWSESPEYVCDDCMIARARSLPSNFSSSGEQE
jgi:hypothetical protein